MSDTDENAADAPNKQRRRSRADQAIPRVAACPGEARTLKQTNAETGRLRTQSLAGDMQFYLKKRRQMMAMAVPTIIGKLSQLRHSRV